jgi:alanine racemase
VRRAVASVDLAAIEHNAGRLVGELTGGAALCAVVKADGYGHGATQSAQAALAGGASMLAVAAAIEAQELRAELPDARLLTMGALSELELEIALAAGSELAVWREGFRAHLAERAEAAGVRPRVHVKYDTGMGRLGNADADAVLALCDAVAADDRMELTGFWTHFATADERDSDFFDEQLERFTGLAERVREAHPGITLHAANSAAVLREPASHFDLVRCGVAIYGLDPFGLDPAAHDLRPALALHSYIADIKPFAAGTSAGYGRSWRAAADTLVGVLPIGYGDGVRRGLSNRGSVLVRGHRQPMVGTISMDNVTVDLGADSDVEPGDEAVLIGAQGSERILAEELARDLDTINYEITCGISPRVPREYRGAHR